MKMLLGRRTLRPSIVFACFVALLAVADAASARTFAWKVTGKGGAIYLVGSVHVLTPDFYPLDPAL